MYSAAFLVTLLSAVALSYKLLSDRRKLPGGLISKMLTSTGFLTVAVLCGGLDLTFGRLVFAALVLCWVGDFLLYFEGPAPFLIGLFVFLSGHLLLAPAFLFRGCDWTWIGAAAILATVIGIGVFRWIYPHVPSNLRFPVVAYTIVISLMAVFAAGTFGAKSSLPILLGAVAFYVSDVVLAREKFITSSFRNRFVNLILYYSGVFLLAFGAAT